MFRIGLAISTAGHGALQRFGPSNIIVRKVRTRRGMKYGLLAMLLAVPYLLIAATYTGLIDQGWSGWLYVIAVICIWDAFKMLALAPTASSGSPEPATRKIPHVREPSVPSREESPSRMLPVRSNIRPHLQPTS